jgi:hypothetical protein
MISSRASTLWRGPGKNSRMGTSRRADTEATSTIASATKRGGTVSAAGEALARFPPSVPRLRICGPPITAQARGNAGAADATSAERIISVCVVAAPIHTWPSFSSMPLISGTPVRSKRAARFSVPSFAFHQDVGAAGQRPHFLARAARISSASSSDRGRK